MTGAIEIARANKEIGSSLEAHPIVYLSDPHLLAALEGVDFAEVCITSDLTLETRAEAPAAGVSRGATRPASRWSSSARGASNARAPGAISTRRPPIPNIPT